MPSPERPHGLCPHGNTVDGCPVCNRFAPADGYPALDIDHAAMRGDIEPNIPHRTAEKKPAEEPKSPEKKAEQSLAERLGLGTKIRGFTTEKGSTYTYDKEGRSTRHKTVENKAMAPMEVTVFLDAREGQVRALMKYMNDVSKFPDGKPRSVHVIEELPDESIKVIRGLDEVGDPDRLYLGGFVGTELEGVVRASLLPEKGRTVFDATYDRKKFTGAAHFGHRVTEIDQDEPTAAGASQPK